MGLSILRRIAAISIAVCVCVTFIPLIGNSEAFATEENGAQNSGEELELSDDTNKETKKELSDGSGNKTDEDLTNASGNNPNSNVSGDSDGKKIIEPTKEGEKKEVNGLDGSSEESGNRIVTDENGDKYCYEGDTPKKGRQLVDGKYYYFDDDSGKMLTGLVTIKDSVKDSVYYFNETMQTGFHTVNGNRYYFSEDADGAALTGFQTLEGDLYYFNKYDEPKGAALTGFQTLGGKTYYFNKYDEPKGAALTGFQTLGGKKYYFNKYDEPKGAALTGFQTLGGKRYYFNKYDSPRGAALTGPQTLNGYKYYFDKTTGEMKTGVQYVGSYYYLYDAKNGVRTTKQGFHTQSGKTYYVTSYGTVARGWRAIDNKAYYFYKTGSAIGSQAKNTTIGYLKIPASGYLGEAYALGIKKLNSTSWTLKQAYKNSYKIKYQGRWWRQKTSELYAIKGFKKNKGNCYVMAATFYIQAKLLGYNVRQIHGKVAYRAPHSWTQIKNSKGKWRVYDPNFKNETGRNGWNIYYGKKGTWRYTNYSVFQK